MTLHSAVVPTWNGARFLGRCLESLLAQEEVDLEVVVCDDASEDDTLEIARGFTDPRVRIHSHDRRLGLAGNWNRARSLARGETFSLVGQDDWVEPRWAFSLTRLLAEHPEAALAFGDRHFHVADEVSRHKVGDFFERVYPEMLEPFRERLLATGTLVPSQVMIEEAMRFCFEINLVGEPTFLAVRREHPAALAGYDPSMAQMIDWEFTTRFFLDGPVVHTPERLGTYHVHARGQSIENAPLSRHYREYAYLMDRLLPALDRHSLEASDRERFLQRRREVDALAREWEEKEREPGDRPQTGET